MPIGKSSKSRSRPDAAEQQEIESLQKQMKRQREAGNDRRANELMDRIQNLAAEAYEKRKSAGYKRGGKVNRSNMNKQMTRGDKMDDENKNASKKKMARGGMAGDDDKKKMARGGMTKKKMARGGMAGDDDKKKMMRGGMTNGKKKMMRGGKVDKKSSGNGKAKGVGAATQGVRKAKMY